jgi:chromosome segregation ATPase
MEKEILELLKNVVEDIKFIKTDINNMKADINDMKTDVNNVKTDMSNMKSDIEEVKVSQSRMEKKLDAVFDQTANLTEFKTEVSGKLDSIATDLGTIELVTSKNWNDLARLKAVK